MPLTTALLPRPAGPSGGGLEAVLTAEVDVVARLEPEPAALTSMVTAQPLAVGRLAALWPDPAADELRGHLHHLRIDTDTDVGIDPAVAATSNEVLDAVINATATAFTRPHQVAHGTNELRPWQALTDPAAAPAWALPAAAMFTGGVVPPRRVGEPESMWLTRARQAVVFPAGMRRGGAQGVRVAVEDTLTGTRRVLIRERANGDRWAMHVHTLTGETPDPDRTRADAQRVAAAGVVVTVVAIDGQTYDDLAAAHATYDDVTAAYTNYDDLATTPP